MEALHTGASSLLPALVPLPHDSASGRVEFFDPLQVFTNGLWATIVGVVAVAGVVLWFVSNQDNKGPFSKEYKGAPSADCLFRVGWLSS